MKKGSLRKTGFLIIIKPINEPSMDKGICISKQNESTHSSKQIAVTSMHQRSTLKNRTGPKGG